MRPSIVGPGAWSAADPPPRFAVDTAGMPLYMVELATARTLMVCAAARTTDNYFFGGDADGVFASGPDWRMPEQAWARLRRASALFYRVIAVGAADRQAQQSVDDGHLAWLPLLVLDPERPPDDDQQALHTARPRC